jgi:NSS family neurotransmitter:Na+ symporter
MTASERFSSRWGLIVSVVGIAVGTGNIWRFPRVAAANGGGSFLIPWVVFLFIWSIPLIIAEFALGKGTRFGPLGAFAHVAGPRWAWMGGFVALVATAIMFYYAVVTGWCLRYLLLAVSGQLLAIPDHHQDWMEFLDSGWQPILFHLTALTLAAGIIRRGVVHGIEAANRFLIPSLLILIIASAARAVTLPGATRGLAYLFTPDLEALLDYRVWLQALTQNAWDTGAGWGLILAYAVYMREREDSTLNAALIGLGNNSISLLAGITIFSTVFALVPEQADELIRMPGPANTGLTFIWIPKLFGLMPGGGFFAALFFCALSFAALTSLISMLELATRFLVDLGLPRHRALPWVFLAAALMGLPSALSTDFFLNQDWVWGIGLMVSGALIALAVRSYGIARFRQEMVNGEGSDVRVGRWYDVLIGWAVPAQVAILVVWWFTLALGWSESWWDPLATDSVGTCLFQWLTGAAVLILFNGVMVRRLRQS